MLMCLGLRVLVSAIYFAMHEKEREKKRKDELMAE